MKLYVWNGVLCDYTSGVAFALGSSPAAARKRLIAQFVAAKVHGLKPDTASYVYQKEYALKLAAREFGDEPEEAKAGYCYGGG